MGVPRRGATAAWRHVVALHVVVLYIVVTPLVTLGRLCGVYMGIEKAGPVCRADLSRVGLGLGVVARARGRDRQEAAIGLGLG